MKILDEYPASKLLASAGIPFVDMELVTTEDEAVRTSGRIGYPVVMKLSSPELTHKTDYGGVIVDIRDASACRVAWKDLLSGAEKAGLSLSRGLRGILIQRMSTGGIEFIIGGKRDSVFGPVVMFGLGGIYTELFRETSFRLAPFDCQEAEKMVRRTRAAVLIDGYRGAPPLAGDVLYQTLAAVSVFMAERSDVMELDINPFLLGPRGGEALDALITFS